MKRSSIALLINKQNRQTVSLVQNRIKIPCYFILILILILSIAGCNTKKKDPPPIAIDDNNAIENSIVSITEAPGQEAETTEVYSIINKSGTTMETRIQAPKGYQRNPSITKELTGFLRELSLKEAGSEVLTYEGLPKANQDAHVAVFDLDVGDRDLQQCADSAIRIYAEYFWSIRAYDKIAFHLTNGFLMEYTKWRDGYRIVVDGNDVKWNKSKVYNDSYEEFRNYLKIVYAYAGTLSLSKECQPITFDQMLPGDLFLYGGSPGHCVLVVDVAEDKDGNRCFLLAQGYMPAQDFHVLKNPLHLEDPWYYSSEMTYPIKTPLWTFNENSLVRWGEFSLNESNLPTDSAEATDASKNTSAIPAMSDHVITPTLAPSSVTLLAVGDNLIHIQVIDSGKQTDGSYNYDHLYSNIKDEIAAADIAVINQETILGGDDFAYSGYPNFNSPTEIGDAVIDTGFDVVLQATNHAMDKGYKGIMNTLSYWAKHPEITTLGINKTKAESKQIDIVKKNGIKIALLNYTYSLNGYSLPADKPYLVDMLDKKKMTEDIKMAEKQADFTIVFPHWGSEYVYKATDMQNDLTDFFYEQGVDLVIGSHPHVLEPVEWIQSDKDHRMLVYYSLGNFISYQREAPRMLGGMANVTITKDSKGTYISDASITPLVTHYENGPSDYHYALYELWDYSENLAKRHGVSDLAQNGSITYQGTYNLAKQILGSWFKP